MTAKNTRDFTELCILEVKCRTTFRVIGTRLFYQRHETLFPSSIIIASHLLLVELCGGFAARVFLLSETELYYIFHVHTCVG